MSEALSVLGGVLDLLTPVHTAMERGLTAKEIERLHDDLRVLEDEIIDLEDAVDDLECELERYKLAELEAAKAAAGAAP